MQSISPIEQALTTSIVNLVIIIILGTLIVTLGRSWWSGIVLKLKEFIFSALRVDIYRVEQKIDDHIDECNQFPKSLIKEKLDNLEDKVHSNFAQLTEKLDTNSRHTSEILKIMDSRRRR